MCYFQRRLKNAFRHKFLLRLVEILTIVISITLLIFFSWSLIEVLLGLLKISFPSPTVPQVVFLGTFLFLLRRSIRVIEEGDEALIVRLGKCIRTLEPGIHLVIPFLDTTLVDTVREQLLAIAPRFGFTRDNIPIEVDSLVYWKILNLRRAYYSIDDLGENLNALVITSILSEIAQLDLREALSSRSKINQVVLNFVDEVAASWGIKILRVEIQDIILSPSMKAGFQAETSAKSLRRAGIIEAEGKKQAAMLDAEIRHLVAIEDVKTDIEVSGLRNQAYKSGILLSKQEEKELREKVEKRVEEERKNFNFNPVFYTYQQADMNAKAESKTMNDSTDSSQTVTIGGNGNVTGSTVNLGTISGAVTNAISQLPADGSTPEQPSLRELLPQLQKVIEEEKELLIEDKADLLEQVKVLAEAKKMAEPEKREGLIRKARKIFDATIKSLPDTAKIVEACSKLLPLILKALSLPL